MKEAKLEKVTRDRYMSKPKEDLLRYGPFWKIIAKHGKSKQFKKTAKLFWRELNVGPNPGQRSIESACKKVSKLTDALIERRVPFDVRIKSSWKDINVYDTDDELHIPENDFDLHCPLRKVDCDEPKQHESNGPLIMLANIANREDTDIESKDEALDMIFDTKS